MNRLRAVAQFLLPPALAVAAGTAEPGQSVPSPAEAALGYQTIFNGKDLHGWDGDPELWTVSHGEIVGSTVGRPLRRNSFLISEERFGDFELRFEVSLRNGNSGMQFRSEREGNWTVRGYQADLARGKGWGSLHGEGLPGGLILDGWQDRSEFFVKSGWNRIAIRCEGHRIRIWVNGDVATDVLDPGSLEGVFAMQLHRGEPMQVRFRNIRVLRISR